MQKRTPRENLKSFSIIYIILSMFYIGALILCNFVPDMVNMFKSNFDNNIITQLNISAVVSTIFYLWYFFMARRVADGKSNGTLFMILLIIGVVVSFVGAFTRKGFGFLSLDVVADLCALYFLYKIKKNK